ncbi:hypothetical protein J4Q44_G00075780 [Coregonus suidteri]|uniref:Uncharacterized protein n=1 Tax=Coregonus suidteri TaxID=861788 RepID=A0AAN8N9M4_9TELE
MTIIIITIITTIMTIIIITIITTIITINTTITTIITTTITTIITTIITNTIITTIFVNILFYRSSFNLSQERNQQAGRGGVKRAISFAERWHLVFGPTSESQNCELCLLSTNVCLDILSHFSNTSTVEIPHTS